MKVKIFQASEFEGIAGLEDKINTWMADNVSAEDDAAVINTQTALCQVAESPEGERFQHALVTVWYQE